MSFQRGKVVMKKILSVAAVLLSVTGLSHSEEPVVPVVPDTMEASTFIELDAGIVALNRSKAQENGYYSTAKTITTSVGIILGNFRGGVGVIGILPDNSSHDNLVDSEGFLMDNPDVAFVGYNAFAGGRYLYLEKYEFNLDVGLTSMDDFQAGNDASAQKGTLKTSGGLFIRPSVNYYITSFIGVRASYFQMIGSDTTVKSMITVGAVFKL